MTLGAEFSRISIDGEEESTTAWLSRKIDILLRAEFFEEQFLEAKGKIKSSLGRSTRRGRGWIFKRILDVHLNIWKYNPLRGVSFLELLLKLKDSKAVLNDRNNDEKCFLWFVLAHLYPAGNNKNRVQNYRQNTFWI